MAFTIHKAKDEGYYVVGPPVENGRWTDVLFAGSLGECLQYVWKAFGNTGSAPQ